VDLDRLAGCVHFARDGGRGRLSRHAHASVDRTAGAIDFRNEALEDGEVEGLELGVDRERWIRRQFRHAARDDEAAPETVRRVQRHV
jgi:hypothetical protein